MKEAITQYTFEKFKYLSVPATQLKMSIEGYLDEHLGLCSDLSFAEQFPFRELSLSKEFFLQKVIVSNGHKYLTGPRYVAQDLSRPFVDLLASTAPLDRDAYRAIMEYWAPRTHYLSGALNQHPAQILI